MKVLLLVMGLVWSVYAENFAVVVGIDNYAPTVSVETLEGACNDAEIFRYLLIKNGFQSDHVTLLLDKDATKKGILLALKEVSKKLNKKRGDKFFYFHAGHGSKLSDIKHPYSDLSKTAVLLPYDANENDVSSFIITQNDLAPYFREIDKKISFGMLIFDSCYSQFAYRSMGKVEDRENFRTRYYQGNISLDSETFSLSGSSMVYPYSHLVSLASSDAYTSSKEDKKAKRGVFSMALEYCLKESSISTTGSLKMCLDRKYTKQVYVFKKPTKSSELETVFTLYHKSQISKTKVSIHTTIPLSQLGTLSRLALFVRRGNHLNDLELIKEGNTYKLFSSPDRILINSFNSIYALKKYLSNYRLIYLKGKEGASLDVKVTYASSLKSDNDCIPPNTSIEMSITASSNLKAKKIAIFSLNPEGKLFMIEPNRFYNDFENAMKVGGESTDEIGTDFLKVMLFDKENDLTKIRVNEETGEILEDAKQIEIILRESQRSSFYEVVRRVITSNKGACQQ